MRWRGSAFFENCKVLCEFKLGWGAHHFLKCILSKNLPPTQAWHVLYEMGFCGGEMASTLSPDKQRGSVLAKDKEEDCFCTRSCCLDEISFQQRANQSCRGKQSPAGSLLRLTSLFPSCPWVERAYVLSHWPKRTIGHLEWQPSIIWDTYTWPVGGKGWSPSGVGVPQQQSAAPTSLLPTGTWEVWLPGEGRPLTQQVWAVLLCMIILRFRGSRCLVWMAS